MNWKIIVIILAVMVIGQSIVIKMYSNEIIKLVSLVSEQSELTTECIDLLQECKSLSGGSSDLGDSNCSCSSNLYNCVDFNTQAEAQACYEKCGSDDIHHLDGDNDGIACESLP